MVCVFCTPAFLSNANAWTQAVCFSLSQTLAGTKGQRRPCPLSPRLSSGEQEIPLWYTSNAKASLRTHDSEVEPGQGHLRHSPELSPPSRAHKRHPRHLRLPHALFAAPAALLVDAMWSLPSDTHTAAGPLRLG